MGKTKIDWPFRKEWEYHLCNEYGADRLGVWRDVEYYLNQYLDEGWRPYGEPIFEMDNINDHNMLVLKAQAIVRTKWAWNWRKS